MVTFGGLLRRGAKEAWSAATTVSTRRSGTAFSAPTSPPTPRRSRNHRHRPRHLPRPAPAAPGQAAHPAVYRGPASAAKQKQIAIEAKAQCFEDQATLSADRRMQSTEPSEPRPRPGSRKSRHGAALSLLAPRHTRKSAPGPRKDFPARARRCLPGWRYRVPGIGRHTRRLHVR